MSTFGIGPVRKRSIFLLIVSFFLMRAAIQTVRAEGDPFALKLQNQTEDVKAGTKKTVRTVKRQLRKATRTNTPAKNAKDRVMDAQDDLEKNTNKVGNRIKHAQKD